MKKLFALITSALLLASPAWAAESEGWLTDYKEGLAAAKESQKNMMVLFTAMTVLSGMGAAYVARKRED